jgi:predicted GNAT family N-acyltransferase
MLTKLVSTKQEYEDALNVRKIVFVDEQNVPIEEEIDQYEDDCYHFITYNNDEPIAAGRLRKIQDGGKVERICVLKPYRKQGVGKLIMDAIEKKAEQLNISPLYLNAQTHAKHFYTNLNYKVISDIFMDAGIPHITMKKDTL